MVQKHCILICNSPPYLIPVFECQTYSGKNAEQLAGLLQEVHCNPTFTEIFQFYCYRKTSIYQLYLPEKFHSYINCLKKLVVICPLKPKTMQKILDIWYFLKVFRKFLSTVNPSFCTDNFILYQFERKSSYPSSWQCTEPKSTGARLNDCSFHAQSFTRKWQSHTQCRNTSKSKYDR